MFIEVPTVASFTTLTGLSNGDTVYAQGYNVAADGGGGLFVYDSSSALTVDNGMVFNAPSPLTGRLIRSITEGFINLLWFGAYAAGNTDSSAATQAWLSYIISNNAEGFIPGGLYKIDYQSTYTISSVQRSFSIKGAGTDATRIQCGPENIDGWILITTGGVTPQRVYVRLKMFGSIRSPRGAVTMLDSPFYLAASARLSIAVRYCAM